MWILDPTAEDVQGLDDGQLLELVLRLCRQEAQTLELPTSSVTKGGNPSAKDGGIDIRVAGMNTSAGDLLRLPAVIQVKAQMMPVGEITREMSPGGTLRPARPWRRPWPLIWRNG